MSDIKIFLKYVIETINPKNFYRKIIFWQFLTIICLITLSFLTQKMKELTIAIFFLILGFLELLKWYNSGEHRRWQRDILNIPSQKEIQELKDKEIRIIEDNQNAI